MRRHKPNPTHSRSRRGASGTTDGNQSQKSAFTSRVQLGREKLHHGHRRAIATHASSSSSAGFVDRLLLPWLASDFPDGRSDRSKDAFKLHLDVIRTSDGILSVTKRASVCSQRQRDHRSASQVDSATMSVLLSLIIRGFTLGMQRRLGSCLSSVLMSIGSIVRGVRFNTIHILFTRKAIDTACDHGRGGDSAHQTGNENY